MGVNRSGSSSHDNPWLHIGAFIVVTLALAWLISFVPITDTVPPYTSLLIMLVPATVALSIRRVQGESLRRTIGSSLRGSTPVSLVFACLYPVVLIGIAALIALQTGLGTYQPGPENIVVEVFQQGGSCCCSSFCSKR